ncbi:MAG: radical SAM protein [Deltaproteobacteria bacterium]|nr:MAG: radical SAM protein [Deltaproteobacteria bacterium]
MSTYHKIRDYTLVKFASTALSLLASASDQQLIKLSFLAEKIPRKEPYKEKIRWIRHLFGQRHPGLHLARRVLKDTNPLHRHKIIQNFIINQLLVGTNKRKEFEVHTGTYPPDALLISPTMRCDLNCYGCYAGYYPQEEDLPLEVIDRVITEAKEMGIYLILLTGGEPFLRKDLFSLFEEHEDVGFQVYTNARLIDRRMVDRFAALGNVMLAISLEGLEEETDRRRGKGHFRHIVKVMDMMRECGLFFAVSTTQTRENTEVLASDEFIDFLVEKGCILMWNFHYVPIGRRPDLDLMAAPQQRDYMRQRLQYFRATKQMLFVDFWNDGHLTNGCIAGGRKYLHITASGDVEPCVFCHFAEDNIKEKTLLEVLNSRLFRAIRSRQPFTDNPFRPCMLIDDPVQGRDLALNYARRFTHPGAEILFTELADQIDRYSCQYRVLAETAWEEYQFQKAKKGKVATG